MKVRLPLLFLSSVWLSFGCAPNKPLFPGNGGGATTASSSGIRGTTTPTTMTPTTTVDIEKLKKRVCPKGLQKYKEDYTFLPIACCDPALKWSKTFQKCITIVPITTTAEPTSVSDIFGNCPQGSQALKIENESQNSEISYKQFSSRRDHKNVGFIIGLHVPFDQDLTIENLRWADGSLLGEYRPWFHEGFYSSKTDKPKSYWVAVYSHVPSAIDHKKNSWLAVNFADHINAAGKNSYYSWIACGVDAVEPVDP